MFFAIIFNEKVKQFKIMMKIIFLPTLRSAVLNSHIRATVMISFILTNTIMKAVAVSTSSGLCSEDQLPNSMLDFMDRIYLYCSSIWEVWSHVGSPLR